MRKVKTHRAVAAVIEPVEQRILLAVDDVDTSFGVNGRAVLPGDSAALDNSLNLNAIPLSDGRIVVTDPEYPTPYVQRFLPNGQLDSSFAAQSLADQLTARVGKPLDYQRAAGDVVFVRGGGIVDNSVNQTLARIKAGSRLQRIDPYFGKHGVQHLPLLNSYFGAGYTEQLAD